MTFPGVLTLISPRRCFPPGLPAFFIGTFCGVGITLIAGSYVNLGTVKIHAAKETDLPVHTTVQGTQTNEAEMQVLDEAKEGVQTSESNCEAIASNGEQTSQHSQSTSWAEARPNVEVGTVQLHDLNDLEDYSYKSEPEAVEETPHQDSETRFVLSKDSCWCRSLDRRAILTPLLRMISECFSKLEKIPFDYTWKNRFSRSELVAANEEMKEIRESLKHASLRFAIRQGCAEFVARRIIMTRTIAWDLLELAITSGHLEVVKEFTTLEDLDDDLKHLGLEEAAYQGRLEIMDLFMWDDAVDVDGCGKTSPLKAAAAAGQVDAIKKLIRVGADLEAQGKASRLDDQDYTPLIAAVRRNQAKAVEVLIKAGAGINNYQARGRAPLSVAFEAGFAGIVFLLLQHGADTDPLGSAFVWERVLELALKEGHHALARKALVAGANVNLRISLFGTFLKLAITLGDELMTRLLIICGADIHYLEPTYELGGNCALLAAASCRNPDILSLLLLHGASIDKARGAYGNLMQTVAHLGYADHMDRILERRPDIDVDAGGPRASLSPLCMAVNYHLEVRHGRAKAVEGSDHVQVIRLLLGHRARLKRRRENEPRESRPHRCERRKSLN